MSTRLVAAVWLAAAGVAVLAGGARVGRGDSIDDAEAQRRGVPVIVVQLENQLKVQKRKTSELEKQIAEQEKKIASFDASAAAKGPVSLDPQLPKPVNGPRKTSAVYEDLVARYMAGDWAKLSAELASKSSQVAALGAGNAADVAYMRAAIAECRPAWWSRAASKSAATFDVIAFNRTLTVNYTPDQQYRSNAGTSSGKMVVVVSWPLTDIDSSSPVDTSTSNLQWPSGNYTKGDLMYYVLWSMIAQQMPLVELGSLKVAALDKDEEGFVVAHKDLCGAAAGIYYGTPAARFLALAQSSQAFESSRKGNAAWAGRRQFGAFLAAELMMNPEKYPSLKTTISLPEELPEGTSPEEYLLTSYFSNQWLWSKLTFAEDCALRQAVWDFMMANTDWTAEQIVLPNGLAIELDRTKEPAAWNERWAWYLQTAANLSKNEAGAAPAATAP